MKASKMKKAATALLFVAVVAVTQVSAQPAEGSDENQYAYVMVTGSNLPQKVKIKRIGTTTVSPLRYYDRREIAQTGRFSTEEVLRTDPTIRVHGFGQAGPSN